MWEIALGISGECYVGDCLGNIRGALCGRLLGKYQGSVMWEIALGISGERYVGDCLGNIRGVLCGRLLGEYQGSFGEQYVIVLW
jgi:hypothetical protein